MVCFLLHRIVKAHGTYGVGTETQGLSSQDHHLSLSSFSTLPRSAEQITGKPWIRANIWGLKQHRPPTICIHSNLVQVWRYTDTDGIAGGPRPHSPTSWIVEFNGKDNGSCQTPNRTKPRPEEVESIESTRTTSRNLIGNF